MASMCRSIVPKAAIAVTILLACAACSGGDTTTSTATSRATGTSSDPTSGASSPASRSISVAGLEGKLLFARAGGEFGDETVFAAEATGADELQLTPFNLHCCARWSTDGSQILLAAPAPDGRITTGFIDPDGSNLRLIPLPDETSNLGPGAWSPDGRWVAFQLWDETDHGRDGIYIGRSSDGSGLHRVTKVPEGADIPGDFSPDGEQLVFLRERPDEQSVGTVYVVDVDGGKPRRLTPRDMAVGWTGVRWSPDGELILLPDARDRVDERSLWTVRPDGSNLRRVFTDPEGRYATSPVWSPDGRYIMFALSESPFDFEHPANGIYVIRRDGTGLTLVLGGDDHKRPADWIPS
jgi:Tol biopolymer transport system component